MLKISAKSEQLSPLGLKGLNKQFSNFFLFNIVNHPTYWLAAKCMFYGRWNPIFHPPYYIHWVVFRSKLID